MKLKYYFFLSLSLVAAGCGSSDDDDAATTATTTETATEVDVSTGTALNAGVLAISSIDSQTVGLSTGSLRLQSEDESDSDDSDDGGNESPSSRDPLCSDRGTPFDSDGNVITPSDENYPLAALYCTVAFNQGSPDSVLGAISIPGVLLCELERAEAWSSDDDFTEGGNNVGDVTITISTNCADEWLAEALSDGGDGVYPLSGVTLTSLPATHGYDKKISFSMGEGEDDQVVFIRSSDNVIAARTDGWAFSIDLVNNVVHYETLGESTGSESGESYVRRIRLRLEGTLASTGAFETIDSLQALKLEGRGVDEDWSELITLSGSPDSGLAYTYYYEDSNAEFQSVEDGCSVSDCSSIDAITATQTQIDTFHSQAQVDYLAHVEEEGVVFFDAVDLSANVAYDTKRD